MTRTTGGNGGRGTRLDLRSSCVGSLTVEVAAGVVSLALVTTSLLGLLGVAGSQLSLMSIARDAARAASLQSDRAGATRAVQGVVDAEGRVNVSAISSEDGFVTVTVERRIRPLRIPVTLSARAAAIEEVPW